MTVSPAQQAEHYRRIEAAIEFIGRRFQSRPSLEAIARAAHLSKYHFQRVFRQWAGVSPGQFVQLLTLEFAKRELRRDTSILDASLAAGLSGPGRLHDLFVVFEAVTPGEFRRAGDGLRIAYGRHPTPFGECVLAATARGICHLAFLGPQGLADVLDDLRRDWPAAELVQHQPATSGLAARIFDHASWDEGRPFHLLVRGTNFQINVWKALLSIPEGSVASYQQVAESMGCPSAVRAVGGAIARNPVAYLIPCHRVILRTGATHNYRWGATRKQAILVWERCRSKGTREAGAIAGSSR